MEITKTQEGSTLNLTLIGRLDTVTSPQLQDVLDDSTENASSLILDFAQLDYVSSAGLRILLAANKRFSKTGTMTIRHVNDVVKEVFDMTGFSDILNIE